MIHIQVLAVLLLAPLTVGCAQTTLMNTNHLQLQISEITNKPGTSTNLVIAVCFTNRSTQDLRLLNRFEPVPVFFSWVIKKKDGPTLDLPGGGKISFGPEPLTYIELKPNTGYTIELDLARFVRQSGSSLTEGDYEISTSYQNQYGKDCVKGILPSNTIRVGLKGSN